MDHKIQRLNDEIVNFVKAPTHPLLTVHSYHSVSSIFHLHFTELRISTAMYFYCLSREALLLPNNQRTSHSNPTPVTSCGNSETAFSSLQSDTPQPPSKPPPSSLCLLPSMTLLIQHPDIVLKMFALSMWSQNELPAEIIGSLQDIDKYSVTLLTFIISKRRPHFLQTANLNFKKTSRFTHVIRCV